MFLTLSLSVCFSFFLNVSYDLLTGEALQDISQMFSCQKAPLTEILAHCLISNFTAKLS